MVLLAKYPWESEVEIMLDISQYFLSSDSSIFKACNM